MSPYEIELLLDIHCSPAELPNAKVPLLDRTLNDFENEGLIVPDSSFDSGWTTTLRGEALVKMLCDTPMPKQVWIDPRSGEIVEARIEI